MSLLQQLGRRKKVTLEDTALPRVLTLVDLTALGIGSTIGVGFYVLAGEIARSTAGPAVILSFVVAAIASVLSGLCYAEFGGRVPKAGSAYIYTYVCVGEFVAFVIGWNLILEYLIGTASVAAGFSGYIDTFTGSKMSEALNATMHMDTNGLAEYPNFLAAALCLTLTAILAFGVKESSSANNVVTGVNLLVVVYVIISVATRANPKNWQLTPTQLNATCDAPGDYGAGGFAPYGFTGIISGAASCFYGFVGFDIIASTGEEAKRPERNLPLSICLSLAVIFVAYFSMSAMITLAVPYCNLDKDAPLLVIYETLGMTPSYWIVAIGAMFGFSASLLGAIFPMPRIIYAMATDGLLFRPLAKVSPRYRSPVRATFLSGILAAILATIFDVATLVNMMSIGTLQAYTIVALCVMMLRFSIDPMAPEDTTSPPAPLPPKAGTSFFRRVFNVDGDTEANEETTKFVTWATMLYAVVTLALCILLRVLVSEGDGGTGAVVTVSLVGLLEVLILVTIWRQPRSSVKMPFEVPLVPWLPGLSAFINLYLMVNLPVETWYKFIVWIAVGLAVYFLYSMWYGAANAAMAHQDRQRLMGTVNATFEADGSDGTASGKPRTLSALEDGQKDAAGLGKARKSIVPTINVLPATPMAPKHATHNDAVTQNDAREDPVLRRHKKGVVISPLVTAELAARKKLDDTNHESSSSSSESDHENDSSEKLASVGASAATSQEQSTTASADGNSQDTVDSLSAAPGSTRKEVKRPDSPIIHATPLILNHLIDDEEDSTVNTHSSKTPNGRRVTDSPLLVRTAARQQLAKTLSSPPAESASVTSFSKPRHRLLIRTSSADNVLSSKSAATNNNSSTSSIDKQLWRNSSFEHIPPSTPDSPNAKRVQHFWVIPVVYPTLPDEEAISSPVHQSETQAERSQGDFLEDESNLSPIKERGESKVSASSSVLANLSIGEF